MHATFPIHPTFLGLITLVLLSEEYELVYSESKLK
jgi:hypothetical protein